MRIISGQNSVVADPKMEDSMSSLAHLVNDSQLPSSRNNHIFVGTA